MRKISDSLRSLQQEQREKTMYAVKTAVQELWAEDYPISIKLLCERTGLSRSVFSKPHVRYLLADLKAANRSPKIISDGVSDAKYEKLLLQLEKSKRREDELKSANIRLRDDVQSLRSECELLRGELHTLMQQLRMQRPRGGELK